MDRDPELDQLLAPLRDIDPSEARIKRWQKALTQQTEVSSEKWAKRSLLFWFSLAAAMLLGFAGGYGMGQLENKDESTFAFNQSAATKTEFLDNID